MNYVTKRFYPTRYESSVYEIDFEELYKEGYRGILFDIDNTLVPHGKPADDRAIALFAKLREIGFHTYLISNNGKQRVESFAEQVKSDCIFGALKPSRRNYRAAMKAMGTDENNTILIGDQLFTDIWGANRTGIESILVEPIQEFEEIQIVWKRKLKRKILEKKPQPENASK